MKLLEYLKKVKIIIGARKIKVELEKIGYQVSRRRIRKFNYLNGLVSNYTVKQYKVYKATCNNDKVDNVLNREFDRNEELDAVVSD